MLSRAVRPFRRPRYSVRNVFSGKVPMVQSFKRGRGSAQYDNTDNLPPFELEGRHPNWPKHVRIVEVGMRDGLQNEQVFVRTDDKLKLLDYLVASGLTTIEATSFVSSHVIPQLKDSRDIMKKVPDYPNVNFPVLVPNMKYFERAVEAGAKEVAIFTSTSGAFVEHNMKSTKKEVNAAYLDLVRHAVSKGIRVRGYLSCVVTCPYTGPTEPEMVAELAEKMINWGCYEVSLGDTTGAGTPGSFRTLLYHVLQRLEAKLVAVHCHNTYGQALANILASLEMGVTAVDSSVAGLGGCPFSPGATGNVATEDVVFMLQGMGVATGVDLFKLMNASRFISSTVLDKQRNSSHVTQAFPLSERSL